MAQPIRALDWVCHSPSHYNSQLFAVLARELGIPFQVHYTESRSGLHPWREAALHDYPYRIYERRSGIDFTLIRLLGSNPHRALVTGCWQDPTSELAILQLISRGRPVLLFNDTPDPFRRRGLLKHVLRSGFLRLAFRGARAVLAAGRPAVEAIGRMGCPPEKLVNFPYFIDLDRYPFRPNKEAAPLCFGTCARLHRDKGVDLALRALAAHRGHPFRYLVAGDGPEREPLRRLAADLGVADRVEWLGWIEAAALPDFYKRLHYLLHPARFEPFGVPVIEAMASGCAVIASDRTAAAVDRIRHGGNGLLHEAGSADALASAIAAALGATAEARLAMAHRARATSEQWPPSRAAAILRQLLDLEGADAAAV